MASQTSTVYFGYGSNLWLQQMRQRCPASKYLGVARLNNYKWIINDRGYANVVELHSSSSDTSDATTQDYAHVVFGLVYSLQPSDESRLDKNEGVPHAYTKEYLACDFWASEDGAKVDVDKKPTQTKDMLVYIDRKRVTDDEPKDEYVVRMNKGIDDAVVKGVPEKYVKDVMRKFIPAEDKGNAKRRSVEAKAYRQALEFVDENEERAV